MGEPGPGTAGQSPADRPRDAAGPSATSTGPRIHVDLALDDAALLSLPAAQARHVQVLRLQPGDACTLFNGRGGEWRAQVIEMGRQTVSVRLVAHVDIDRELPCHVTLALGMPANERMDALIEKATELGVAAVQPLVCERSVLRLAGERAERRLGHWRGIAAAASEQSGRTRLPVLHPVRTLREWLNAGVAQDTGPATLRMVLSPLASERFQDLAGMSTPSWLLLSGPEGGLTPAELDLAQGCGFRPATLGPRILRADTAPLAALAWCALATQPPARLDCSAA